MTVKVESQTLVCIQIGCTTNTLAQTRHTTPQAPIPLYAHTRISEESLIVKFRCVSKYKWPLAIEARIYTESLNHLSATVRALCTLLCLQGRHSNSSICLANMFEWGTKVSQGSTCNLLVHEIMPDSPEENLKNMWKEAVAEYDKQGVPLRKRFGGLRMTMFSTARESPISLIEISK